MNCENIFKALSNPNRLRIIIILERRVLCVCKIRSALGLSNSTVSEHLAILKKTGLITDSKKGKWVYYRLNRRTKNRLVQHTLQFIENAVRKNILTKNDTQKTRTGKRKQS